jgi:hypothetical protein
MDDLTKQVLNEVAEPETVQTDSPTVEENDVEVQDEESVATETESEETTEQPTKEDDQPPKKGAESRIRELNAKAKQAEAEAKQERAEKESLARKIQELTGSVEPQGYVPNNGYNPNQPLVAPGEEVTQEELQARVARRDQWLLQQADNMARFREAQRDTYTRINNESLETEKAYPQLNPDSEQYDEELSNSIAEASLAFVKTNPAGSLKKFVDGLMKPYQRSLDKSVASQQTEIAKQASQSAMRPNQVPSNTEKKVEEMNEKELEKRLGFVY